MTLALPFTATLWDFLPVIFGSFCSNPVEDFVQKKQGRLLHQEECSQCRVRKTLHLPPPEVGRVLVFWQNGSNLPAIQRCLLSIVQLSNKALAPFIHPEFMMVVHSTTQKVHTFRDSTSMFLKFATSNLNHNESNSFKFNNFFNEKNTLH